MENEIKKLQKEVYANAVAHGFWDGQVNLAEKLALIHSEVSEALEVIRKKSYVLTDLAEELADTVIRVMDLAEYMSIDLSAAIKMKHKRNVQRPHKHGKRF